MASRLPAFVEATPRVRVPAGELSLSFAASGGPGGQNVNKVASKAVLRWNVVASSALGAEDRALVLARLASRLTADGDLVIASDVHRDQPKNVEEVLRRLRVVLSGALHRPKPRRPSRPTRSSKERRLKAKRRHSARKQDRRSGGE
jgi:ribosome-associated protein